MKKIFITIISLLSAGKSFGIVETSFKATENVAPAWNIELRNRTTKPIKIKVVNDGKDLFKGQNKLAGKSALGLLKESAIPVVRSNDISLGKRTYIGIYNADGSFLKGYEVTGSKPIFVSWENGALRTQTGKKVGGQTQTQSGIVINYALEKNINNIQQGNINNLSQNDFDNLIKVNLNN